MTRPTAAATPINGLLFRALLDPSLAIEGDRMERAQARLLRVLPDQSG